MRIRFKTNANVLSEVRKEPEKPSKPRKSINPYSSAFPTSHSTWETRLHGVMDFIDKESTVSRPTIEEVDGFIVVRYFLFSVPQEDSRVLESFYLEFPNDVEPSRAIGFEYEIRAENASRVARGTLLAKFEAYDADMPASYLFDVLR